MHISLGSYLDCQLSSPTIADSNSLPIIQVEPDDEFPQKLCTTCLSQIRSWSAFEKSVQESDQKLRLQRDEETWLSKGYTVKMIEKLSVDDGAEDLVVQSFGEADDDGEEGISTGERSTEIKPKVHAHKCGYCDWSFPFPYKLKDHERIHTNERPFKCDECEKEFKLKYSLSQHKLIHVGIKSFGCVTCEKKFLSKTLLTKHKRIHDRLKAFECDQCHRRFSQNSHLKLHKLTHSKERQLFKCKVCDKMFLHTVSLAYHLKTQHK